METLKFIETLENKTLSSIRSGLYKKGILSNYNADGRIVLYLSKTQRFNKNSRCDQLLFNECNGLIIDANNLKILALPPQSFRSNVDTEKITKYLNKDLYDLFLIEDGTTINLYYWSPSNSWRISTARSYDCNNTKWGDITYSEIISELLLINNITTDEFYNSLDKNTSYTFGFKHASMHPFREGAFDPINKLWFIQSFKNGTISYEFENNFNIKVQPRVELQDKEFNTKYMFSTLKHSIYDFTQNGNVLYGYILRSKDTTQTDDHNSILLESSLLQTIRKLYYHSSFNDISNEKKYNRDIYTIIAAYVDINSNSLFLKLFPQYLQIYNKLNIITNNLITNLLIYNSNRIDKTLPIYKATEFIYKSITSQFTIIHGDKRNVEIFSTFLLNKNNVGLYYSLLLTA